MNQTKPEQKKVQRKAFLGKVVSTKRANTVGVKVERFVQHPFYGKAMRRTTTLAVHNEKLQLALGDTVWIEACRPVSKTKHFIVTEKV